MTRPTIESLMRAQYRAELDLSAPNARRFCDQQRPVLHRIVDSQMTEVPAMDEGRDLTGWEFARMVILLCMLAATILALPA